MEYLCNPESLLRVRTWMVSMQKTKMMMPSSVFSTNSRSSYAPQVVPVPHIIITVDHRSTQDVHVVVIREVFCWDTEKDTPPPEWPSSVNRMITPDNIFKCDQIRFRYEFIGNTSDEEVSAGQLLLLIHSTADHKLALVVV